ncbi:hypothetical protein AX14_009554 [Amanita brunnescens Koide BX004]|nr:hypothetical protein AX14_009554 [Amanita brunnescens Koide BX004]
MPPPAAPPTASSPGPVAMHSTESLHKPPRVSMPQSLTQVATSHSTPIPPAASLMLPASASAGATHLPVPTPPIALLARPSGASAGSPLSPLNAPSGFAPVMPPTPPGTSSALPSDAPTGPAPLTAPTSPVTRVSSFIPPPFRGRRGTKPNELHVQFKSRAEFNTKLMRFYENNVISHRHALLDALVSALFSQINDETKAIFAGNKLRAAFWSPRGNLIMRFLRAPSPGLLELFLNTLKSICGAQDFTILNRPTVSPLKLSKVLTHNHDDSPIDMQQLALDLLSIPQLNNAAFWHTPRFVSFKGAPIGRSSFFFFFI